jgi:hypothetical protein
MLSGILGCVNGLCVYDWEVSLKSAISAIVNSGTKTGTARRTGNQDWNGSFSFHGVVPPLMPGYTGAFAGGFSDTVGAISGPIIVDEAQIKWDIEGAKPVEGSVKFSGNGAWSTTATAATGAGESLVSSVGTTLAGAASIGQVRTITLTIKRSNKGGTHSGSSGWVNRREGNLDCTLAASVYVDSLASLPQPNSDSVVTITCAGSAGIWTIDNMIWGDISGVKVDIESGAIIGATLNAMFDAYPANVIGSISGPGAASSYWPGSGNGT